MFNPSSVTRSVPENSPPNTNVGAPVTAGDAEDAGDLAYTLSGSTLFTIVGTSGQIRVASGAVLDHEDDDEHTVTVTARDPSGGTDTATVSIEVADVNEPPTAGDDSVSTDEDTAVTFGVLGNDSDPETASASLTVALGSTRPGNGAVTLNASTRQFTYTPDQDFHGVDSFTYTLSDGANGVTATVTVTVASVNDAPDFGASTAQRSIAETARVGDRVGAAVAATDPDHATLSYALSGTADLAIEPTTGQITVAAALDHETTDIYTATVTAEDGAGASASIQVTVTVTNVNEPPTAGDDSVSTDEDTPVTVDVLANDSDPDTSTADLSVSLVSSRLPGGTAVVNAGTKQITYTPNENANGVHTFDYRVTDDGGNRDVGTVRVTIRPVNDAPRFTQKQQVAELQLVVREGAGEGVEVGTPVTAVDPDQDGLTYSLSGASDFAIDPVTAQITVGAGITIDRERTATYSGTVSASDGEGGSDTIPIRIEVSDVPEPPTVVDDEVTATEDTPLTIDVLRNDTDPDTTPEGLTVRVLRQPLRGRAEVESDKTITYVPNPDSTSQDSFEYQVSDGRNSDEGFVYVTSVVPVNDAPTYASATVTFQVSEDSEPGEDVGYPLTARDVDGDTLTYSLTGSTRFVIHAESGQITTADYLDAIVGPTHTVAVTATDSASPPLAATIEVTIAVVVGAADESSPPSGPSGASPGGGGGSAIVLPPGGGGGGPPGPAPSDVDFEWTVERDIDELDEGNDWPSGLWSGGEIVWILDNPDGAGDAMYAYDRETGERLDEREFELDGRNGAPRGVWSDGDTVWVSDSGQERLFAYDLKTGERLPERDIALIRRNGDARGIWSDGEAIWVLNGNPSLFAYDLETGALLGEHELADANSTPHGLWSDGVTLWVSNHDPKHLFAYRLPVPLAEPPEDPPTLARVPDEDFAELSSAGNNSPRGIWSDGELMYVADENDDRVYTYNMPDAWDARLASLSLEGVDIGEFDPDRTGYEGVPREGAMQTTVAAAAAQDGATVDIAPPDSDGDADGHQVDLAGAAEITVTVTSPDGSRVRVYTVALAGGAPPASCLSGDVSVGFSLLIYEGGSLEELESCAESRHVNALYALEGGEFVPYVLGAPGFVNSAFSALYAEGVPGLTPLTVRSEGPASAGPGAPVVAGPWESCLRGETSRGLSHVLYEGGGVADLAACAEELGLAALYALDAGEFVPYILGAPAFVNRAFGELFPGGVAAGTPLVARRE
ncbi:MAG: tandem-95 repeat protein [Chloroflexi bacterium]|nr:tandem-95 repeat protein [Chloroflexota bacterium]